MVSMLMQTNLIFSWHRLEDLGVLALRKQRHARLNSFRPAALTELLADGAPQAAGDVGAKRQAPFELVVLQGPALNDAAPAEGGPRTRRRCGQPLMLLRLRASPPR